MYMYLFGDSQKLHLYHFHLQVEKYVSEKEWVSEMMAWVSPLLKQPVNKIVPSILHRVIKVVFSWGLFFFMQYLADKFILYKWGAKSLI